MKKLLFCLSLLFAFNFTFSQNKNKFNPSLEIGIAQRSFPFELSEFSHLPGSFSGYSYEFDNHKHFKNFSLSIALKEYVLKKRISVQLASYFRYNHLYYGKNAQGITNYSDEYKRLKYDIFLDGLYHFKKGKSSSVGVELGLGIGFMNLGTRFKDSILDYNNRYEEVIRGFGFLAPRLLVGINKNKFSLFAIAHGTPDSYYRSNPSIWLEFKLAYSFSPFKKREK